MRSGIVRVADLSTLYTGDVNGSSFNKAALEVTIPGGEPTGQVFNGTTDFVVTKGTVSRAACSSSPARPAW